MDQYRSRLKLSEDFERYWSIPFPGEIHMDQSLVHMNFLGKFAWTNGPESSSKVSPYTGIGPWMALPSGEHLGNEKSAQNCQPNGPAEVQCEFFGTISGLNFER